MNRRKALALSLLAGGLAPSTLRAQDPGRRRDDFLDPPDLRDDPGAVSRFPDADLDFGGQGLDDPRDTPPPPAAGAGAADPPDNFRGEAGHNWLTHDISAYTSLAATPENPNPENALVEWIFRGTGSAVWHGESIAVLSAGRARLRAYHNPSVLKRVDEMARRFTDSTADMLSVRVRFVAAQDPRWRYAVFSRLQRVAFGPHGQQAWTIGRDDFNLVQQQLLAYQGFMLLADETLKLVNGQTLTVDTLDGIDYFAGPQREGAVGFQPTTQSLKEGVVLRFSPLLNFEGDLIDAAVDLRATTIQRLYGMKVLAPREVGPNEVAIDVPEVTETRLNQTISRWPLGETLVISAGITPGILQSKTGFLRLPGTKPTDTELLAFLEVEPVRDSPRAALRDADGRR